MAPKKAKTAIKSKNSPDARGGRSIIKYQGREVVLVRMMCVGPSGKKQQSDVAAYKEDALTGKPSMFVMDGDSHMLWSKLSAMSDK